MSERPRRDMIWAGVLFIVLTALGEVLVLNTSILPLAASEQAAEVDLAVNLLFVYSVPVMAFVLAVLFYSVLRWRVSEPTESPDAVADHRGFSMGWFVVSIALAALVFFYPGLTGLMALAEQPEPDMVIELEGVQWHWNVTYEGGEKMIDPAEIVLPADTTIRFEMTSRDVLHAFWVPAFRMKQDVIPGQETIVYVTTLGPNAYEDDTTMRLQCAELCGTGHARMFTPVRVVEEAEFEEWLEEQAHAEDEGMEGMDMGDDGEMDMDEGDEMDMDDDGEMDMDEGDDMDMDDDGDNG